MSASNHIHCRLGSLANRASRFALLAAYRLFVLSNRGRRWGNATRKERQANTSNPTPSKANGAKDGSKKPREKAGILAKAKTTDNKKPRTVEDAGDCSGDSVGSNNNF